MSRPSRNPVPAGSHPPHCSYTEHASAEEYRFGLGQTETQVLKILFRQPTVNGSRRRRPRCAAPASIPSGYLVH